MSRVSQASGKKDEPDQCSTTRPCSAAHLLPLATCGRAGAGAGADTVPDTASGQFSAFGVLAVLRDACDLGNQGTMSWRIPGRPVFKRPWRPLGR